MPDGLRGTRLKPSAVESSWRTSASDGCSTSVRKAESSGPMEASLMRHEELVGVSRLKLSGTATSEGCSTSMMKDETSAASEVS
ncbi:hypothetical protein BDV98DRAFT_556942 [Pterulicium gracile]|uniref:Uncharacterized protein n=1 Tax=Pterulicium gracile TaxID=1884261 RepID=A0A5C3R2P6_9AGAR|nr:hypothetical protein BDV98DRAFT_556942 [Pterula gracilis]